MLKIFLKNKKAFSIIEILIAIFIITTGIVGAMNLINRSISSVVVSKSELIATNLAQEGMEIVRGIRDTNWLKQREEPSRLWDYGLVAGDWRVQYNSQALISLGTNPVLNFNTSTGYYLYDATKPATLFRRKITITNISAYEIKVVCEVSWSERGHSFAISAEDRLYNWK